MKSTNIIHESRPSSLTIGGNIKNRKQSTLISDKSYFEKLRSIAYHRHNNTSSHLITENVPTSSRNLLDDMFENLLGSNQPCGTWNSDDINNFKSQTDILLSKLEVFKQIYNDNGMIKSEEFEQNARQDLDTYSIPTSHGNILFDFSKQSIDYDIYIHLMQLVRLSNLDKFIQKVFHKSGEYHHVDYKEKRQNQLEKEQQNRDDSSDHRSYRTPTVMNNRNTNVANSTTNHINPHSVSSRSPISNKYQSPNNTDRSTITRIDKANRYITLAKAVHFRSSSHCFVFDGIDISFRFQHDRNILRDTCRLFHSYIDDKSNTNQKKNNDLLRAVSSSSHTISPSRTGISYERLCSAMLELDADSNRTILVLCTHQMRIIYRLLESLLKSYVSPNISILYLTFDEIKPFLMKYEQTQYIPMSFASQHSHEHILNHNTSSTTKNMFNNNISNRRTSEIYQSTGLSSKDEVRKEQNINAEVIGENITTSASKDNLLDTPTKTDDKNILSNEELLLDYFRTSSLILIFMKHLDESYLTIFLRWYTQILLNSDLDYNQSLPSSWNKAIEHLRLVTSDYQQAQTVFNIPKTNLFLWPTERNDYDHMSIIISSILILPIALRINYEIYTMFIDGMSIVDKHCQETTFDRNVCIHMALLRIWSTICERKTIGIITCEDGLQHFGEYAQMLLTEYDYIYEQKSIVNYISIHQMSVAKTFLQQNQFSFDLIALSEIDLSNRTLSPNPLVSELFHADKISHPHTFIFLDQLTPFTIGVLAGVYQMSIFFENIIREHIFPIYDQSPFSIE